MTETHDDTTVVIIGAGVAGLALGNFLLRNGVDCTVLEKHARAYVEKRQRAGTIDTYGVRLFRAWGLEEVLAGDPIPHSEGGFYLDGHAMPVDVDDDDNESMYCPQQVLVRNLTEVFLREGGDLRYEAADVALENLTEGRPVVRYRDADGTARVIRGDHIAGCDGFHGVSRRSVPASELTEYSHEYGYSWLSVLAATETEPSGMAIHERGLAGMIPRGPGAGRVYLQCAVDDTPEQWPDERVWSELEARFGTPPARGEILSRQIVPLRSVVFDPMSYGSLYLLGDAAHIVPPMSAKGIHLALHDAEVFARAVIRRVKDGDASLLDGYSQSCLDHVWNYQAFASWITDLMHNAGYSGYEGEFKKRIARAELQRRFTSEAANRLFGELTSGTN
ncbi:4-hydroxybenzoate 3-monooxygenase [Streptomyces sp. NPDC058368]|uniref:4-hydroxybenzoate 3-monooxygenase n=1 Tax=Streptomyces sp. NPDC058368 TaxID=3346461 RepID=UPI00365390EE